MVVKKLRPKDLQSFGDWETVRTLSHRLAVDEQLIP